MVTPTGNSVTFDSPRGVQGFTRCPELHGVRGTASPGYQVTVSGGSGSSSVGCMAFPTTVAGAPRQILNSISMPNGQQYTFYYGNNNPTDSTILNPYGLINEIIYPDGGWVKYKWQLPSSYNEYSTMSGDQSTMNSGGQYVPVWLPGRCSWQYQTPVLQEREVSFDGSTVAQVQTFLSTTWTVEWDPPMAGHRRPRQFKRLTIL